jgi:hypothetical protein
MCVSRLHQVVAAPDSGWIEVDDVHSGYALGPAEAVEAEAVMAELGLSTEQAPPDPISRTAT